MKYLVTLIVCALLTVGLILCVKLSLIQGDWVNPNVAVGVGLILIMTLPLVILFATIWAVIGFTKTVKRWIENNQVDDCPPVMHSRHSKDAHDMLEQHLKQCEECTRLRRVFKNPDVVCPECHNK
jgi:hypothetical protein